LRATAARRRWCSHDAVVATHGDEKTVNVKTNETFSTRLSAATSATILKADDVGVIVDDDNGGGR
jgi:hypothetical protein